MQSNASVWRPGATLLGTLFILSLLLCAGAGSFIGRYGDRLVDSYSDRIQTVMQVERLEVAMRPLRVSENIVPVSDFKAKAADWLRRLAESSEPVVITQNGKAAGVLLSPAAYDELTERFRFIGAVEQGLADVEAGRVTPHAEIVAEMRRRYARADEG